MNFWNKLKYKFIIIHKTYNMNLQKIKMLKKSSQIDINIFINLYKFKY